MKKWIQEQVDSFHRARKFVTQDVWRIGRPGEQIPSGFVTKQIRVAILLLRNLGEDALLVRAAALAFWTVLSIVPFLALMFLVIQSFNLGGGLYDRLQHELDTRLSSAIETIFGSVEPVAEQSPTPAASGSPSASDPLPLPETTVVAATPTHDPNDALKNKIIEWLFQGVAQESRAPDGTELVNPIAELVDKAEEGLTSSGALSTIGILFVITTVFGLLQNIERSFNHIWSATRSRSWFRMFSDYLLVTLLLPFIAAVVLGITAALESKTIANSLGVFALSLRGVQFVMIWFFMSSIYTFVPNARVVRTYALFGGLVAATMWTFMSWGYVRFIVSLANYSIVYSSFAQFPLLLMWLYFSWLILLFGAELTFAYQHEKTFAMERLAEHASHAYKEAVGLRAMVEMAARFDDGKPGLSPGEAAEEWNVPTRLVNQSLEALEKSGLIVQCHGATIRFIPGKSLDRITMGEVVRALREAGEDPSLFREDDKYRALFEKVAGTNEQLEAVTIEELVRHLKTPDTPLLNVQPFPGDAREV